MRFEVLGPLRVEGDGGLVPLKSGKQRALLASLLVAAGEAVSSDRLIQNVWGDDALADSRNTLQHGIAQLRKLLEPGRTRREPPRVLVSEGSGYRLALGEHSLDVVEFEEAVHESRTLVAERPEQAATALEAALALWRGAAYEDFEYTDFARAEQERLGDLRVSARELLVDARKAIHGPDAVIPDLEALVVEHPYREGLRIRLMKALYQGGRQAEALQVYRDTAATLSDELGIAPSPELRELEGQILVQDGSLAQPSAEAPLHNLPTLTTSLIGREHDLGSLVSFLDEKRLVTLLGPGGSGKTRLALAAADRVYRDYSNGAWLARLENLTDPSLVVSTIGSVVGMPEAPEREVIDTLSAFLSDKRTLLILDNCEHLIDAAAELADRLVRDCPQLVILATSQEPLGVSGEQRVHVPPLALPDENTSPFDELDSSPAVELFLERAAAIDPTVDRSAATLNTVANIARALDGIPLAIELAAARTDVLTPVEIAQRLGDRLQLLDTGPRDAPHRQRTLRDAVDWSFQLLNPDEQALFIRLGVFAGGFDAPGAAAVAESTEEETLALLARLVH
ncbi:MAG: BTAD domain-containing putative transcriptional regulator, partial [Gaiellaceae bacterium]